MRFLFSGHIGCGKSSELEHLRDVLKRPGPLHPRYLPILLNASDYLDDFDVSLTDILLAVVAEVAATLKTEFGYDLKDSYFKTRFNEIKEFLLSDVDVGKADCRWWDLDKSGAWGRLDFNACRYPNLWSLLGCVLHRSGTHRREWRKLSSIGFYASCGIGHN